LFCSAKRDSCKRKKRVPKENVLLGEGEKKMTPYSVFLTVKRIGKATSGGGGRGKILSRCSLVEKFGRRGVRRIAPLQEGRRFKFPSRGGGRPVLLPKKRGGKGKSLSPLKPYRTCLRGEMGRRFFSLR